MGDHLSQTKLTLYEILKRFHFTESEITIYLTLLENKALTGYEVSKRSGIARSKIYTLLQTLERKRAIIKSEGKSVLYTATPIEELVSAIRQDMNGDLDIVVDLLKDIKPQADTEAIWKVENYELTIQKAITAIHQSTKNLFVQIWENELTPELIKALTEAEKRLKDFVVILFGEQHLNELPFTRYYKHQFEQYKLNDYGGRWINITSDDQEVLYGTLSDRHIDVMWSKNHSIIFLAKEYIIHDAYCLKIIHTLPEKMKQQFGHNLAGVRNIYSINPSLKEG